VPGDLPEPAIPPDQIPVALLLLQIFAGPFWADSRKQEVEPLLRLLDAVSEHLNAALGRGGARVQ